MTPHDDGGLFALPPEHTHHPAPPEPSPAPHGTKPAAVVNDMDLIESVLQRALEPGYVLTGPGERVWRRRTRRGEEIQPASSEEAAAVHQLLADRFLTRGGMRPVRNGRHAVHATSVLLTAAARTRLRRWRAYTRAACWGQPRHTA
jgi:hypothetical protein